jgi:hypothetical protein
VRQADLSACYIKCLCNLSNVEIIWYEWLDLEVQLRELLGKAMVQAATNAAVAHLTRAVDSTVGYIN